MTRWCMEPGLFKTERKRWDKLSHHTKADAEVKTEDRDSLSPF